MYKELCLAKSSNMLIKFMILKQDVILVFLIAFFLDCLHCPSCNLATDILIRDDFFVF